MTDDQIERVARVIAKFAVPGHDEDEWRLWTPEASAAIAAASEWMPIESAPKDGTQILLWLPLWKVCQAAVYVNEGEFGPGWVTHDGAEVFNATAWQPLPQPPKVTT